MFSHVMIGATDLVKARTFYDAVLSCVGLVSREVVPDGVSVAVSWTGADDDFVRFYVCKPVDGAPASAGNGVMIAFAAPDAEAVVRGYEAALAAGAADAGAPGPRPHYGAGYFGAYFRDPWGNKIHLAFRGDAVSE